MPASEAAIGRLHEATGRPVLTAAAEGKPALEGHEGNGVFTWALLDALKNGDRNGNGTIELSELVAHVLRVSSSRASGSAGPQAPAWLREDPYIANGAVAILLIPPWRSGS